jgi:hypothetical protein
MIAHIPFKGVFLCGLPAQSPEPKMDSKRLMDVGKCAIVRSPALQPDTSGSVENGKVTGWTFPSLAYFSRG